MIVLGISGFYHDSGAALVRDGEIVAAAQEERFSRKKGDAEFPAGAVRYCLAEAGITLDDVDKIGFYDKPLLTFDRLLETYLAFAPRGLESFVRAMPVWLKDKLLLKANLLRELRALGLGKVRDEDILFDFHHHSHAASAFYPSPFESAAVLVMDGVGEWATTSLGHGKDGAVTLLEEIRFPHSIGMLYSAFTYYLGFKVNDGEYKVMGLAPYGEPTFEREIRDNLIDIKEDGSFHLDMRYFNYCTGLTMTNAAFDGVFGGVPPRKSGEPLTERHMNLARSLQAVTEDVILRLGRTARERTGEENLCLAGGVALNCVANGRLLREGPFKNVWIQPAAGDAGGALGVALSVAYANGETRPSLAGRMDGMKGAYLGPAYGRDEIVGVLERHGAVYEELDEPAMLEATATALADEKVIGWFQGRMEFGPRALGHRSILGDARSARMQRTLNMKIKYRESFRPFAPIVLREDVAEHFETDVDSPYMLLVDHVLPAKRRKMTDAENALTGIDKLNVARSDVPAITHVDYSARIQTVHAETNPRLDALLRAFKAKTGYGVLVNTSFNIRDEPVVCSPEDAYRCFMGTEMDMLVLDTFVLRKEAQ